MFTVNTQVEIMICFGANVVISFAKQSISITIRQSAEQEVTLAYESMNVLHHTLPAEFFLKHSTAVAAPVLTCLKSYASCQ